MNRKHAVIIVLALVGLLLAGLYITSFIMYSSSSSAYVRVKAVGSDLQTLDNSSVVHRGAVSMSGLTGSGDNFTLVDARLRYLDRNGQTIAVRQIDNISLRRPGAGDLLTLNTTLPQRPAVVYLEGKQVITDINVIIEGWDFQNETEIRLNRSQYIYSE